MSNAVLIAALSGRALAAAARRGGLRPYVLDLFGDQDTMDLAEAHCRVEGDVFAGLAGDDLLQGARFLDELAGATLPLIFGAGLESRCELLAKLAEGRVVLGNTPETVARVKDPRRFFAVLDDLGIAYPAVRYAPPADSSGWLAKRIGGSGGLHIRPAGRTLPAADVYFQERLAGRPLGIAFLAAAGDARVVSVNELWGAVPDSPECFAFGGMAGPVMLPSPLQQRILSLAQRLARRFALVGLNSIDVLLDGDALQVLEINPRPGAAVDLYRQGGGAGIMARHVAACRGDLPDRLKSPKAAGLQVVYAQHAVTVAHLTDWPDWLLDRPAPGVQVGGGEPLCSVVATGTDAEECQDRLRARAEASLAALTARQSARVMMR